MGTNRRCALVRPASGALKGGSHHPPGPRMCTCIVRNARFPRCMLPSRSQKKTALRYLPTIHRTHRPTSHTHTPSRTDTCTTDDNTLKPYPLEPRPRMPSLAPPAPTHIYMTCAYPHVHEKHCTDFAGARVVSSEQHSADPTAAEPRARGVRGDGGPSPPLAPSCHSFPRAMRAWRPPTQTPHAEYLSSA